MVFVPAAAVGIVGMPVRAGELSGALAANKLVMVVAKFASLPNAVANSFNVFSVPGADATNALIAACTNAVLEA